jgi:DNA polymerase (family 10)
MKFTKNLTNTQLAKLLRAVAAALELSPGDNRFRITAYERAADSIEHASSEVKDLWDEGDLGSLAGVGESIASHLDELFSTGRVRHFNHILKPFPPAMFELLEIPGLGPKSAFKLCKALGLNRAHSAITKLQKAARKGLVAKIEDFGEDSQAAILKGITEYQNRSHRLLLTAAEKTASEIITWLKKIPEVKSADTLGSLRRQASTVGDIDISVSSDQPERVIAHFTAYPKSRRILEAGDRTASLILPNDHQVDLMVQPPDAYGSLLQHFTGSKHHNIALREYALKKGYSLSEYGIKTKTGQKKFSDEASFYHFLGLQFIPPELRENNGEIEAAVQNHLPKLIDLKDIRGDLQIHSSLDVEPSHDLGESSLTQLTQVAADLGYEYLGLTEHNPSVSQHTKSQIIDLIKMKTKVIHDFNKASENNNEKIPYLFNGLEIDIQPDGSRALPDDCLDLLDFACVAIHSSFHLSKKAMTTRILAGLDHPKVKYLAHPTARLLLEREGIDLDWEVIFDFCLSHHKWLEIDAWPNRLDLPDNLVREAVSRGIKLVIDTDSHSQDHLEYMRFGVAVARRGWTKASDIINTKSLTEMRQLLGL